MLILDDELLAGASTDFETVDTAADDPAQLYYSSGTTGLAKGILHAHRYLLAHEEFVYCHDVRDGELLPRHGRVGVGGGDRAAARAVAAGRRPSSSSSARAALTPTQQLDFLSRHGVTNVFTTPTAMRSMMADRRRRQALPAEVPHRLLGRRAAEPGGDPLVPRAVRAHGARLLRAHRVLSAVRELPVHGGARGLDGQADARAGTCRSSTRTSSRWRRASAARSACARARTRTTRSATGTHRGGGEETFGGEWFHTKDAAAAATRTATSGTPGRADDVIISAGYRIGPFEVESACIEHPAVREAAAVASPDERRGNVVKAFVVLAEGHEPSDELADEIKAFVRERLSRLRLSRADRVRRRPAEDADRQDPPDRAARARDRPLTPPAAPTKGVKARACLTDTSRVGTSAQGLEENESSGLESGQIACSIPSVLCVRCVATQGEQAVEKVLAMRRRRPHARIPGRRRQLDLVPRGRRAVRGRRGADRRSAHRPAGG